MGDGIESKSKPRGFEGRKAKPRGFEGRKAVGRPSYYQRESICVRVSWMFVILTALVFLIPTTFGQIIRSRWFDWSRATVVFVWSLGLAHILLYNIVTVIYSTPEVVFRYMMWKLLDRFLGSKLALALSDHVREVMPSLAACNPFLTDAVVSSTQESQFIARRLDFAPSMGQIRVEEIHEIEGITLEEPRACSYSFQIGSGQIRVDAFPQNKNNFKFESRARGKLLEEFVTITDWDRIATIFSILRYWEKSPDLGVIDNLYVVHGYGIYCHCLSLQSIVESVCKSREQFSLFKLSESTRFYVGSVPQENSVSFRKKLRSFFLDVFPIVSASILAFSKGSHVVAIVGLCIVLPLASEVFTEGGMCEFPLKLFVHWVLERLCKESWRYRFYRWLKRKGCFLAFCDDFNPVLHRADKESELITLWNCTHGTSFTRPVHKLDWKEINVFDHESSQWQWDSTRFRFVFSTVQPTTTLSTTVHSLFTPGQEATGQDFEWRAGQWRYFELTLSGRTVKALSQCHLNDGEAGGSENVFWDTQLRFDDDAVERLKWKESSYLLFVYLMVKWKTRKFGVISGFRKFWYAQYYHVFSTYELARHIRDNEEKDPNMPYPYHIFTDHPKPTDMVAGYMHYNDVRIAGS
ncbi:hypothetical protein BDL97_16G072700 [Sphagnum fallax]|nr:hypothetical protein BDL97_16G072700 [Sphagnum fallax]KAH8938262.1 hypothetical protein BDL97_16G072700 [Sphagnum fallax]